MSRARTWPAAALCLLSGALCGAATAHARPQAVDLGAAVRAALTTSARVAEASAGLDASDAEHDEARTSLLPRVDAMIQLHRSTNNNVSGALLPTSLFPGITGPVPATADYAGSWGLALSAFFSWDVLDFGRRAARIRLAVARHDEARLALEEAKLSAAGRAATAFFGAAAADGWLQAAQASVVRWAALRAELAALAAAKLRPEVDLALAEVAWRGARMEVIRARELRAAYRAALGRAMGRPSEAVREDVASLLQTPATVSGPGDSSGHPRLRRAHAAVEAERRHEAAVQKEAYPELRIVGYAAGRAAGADARGEPLGGAHGLYPEAFNWGAGVVLVAPLLELVRVASAGRAASARRRAAEARVLRAERSLAQAQRQATLSLRAAEELRLETPARVAASTRAATDVKARYAAGLVPFTELAEAERLRTAALADDVVARLRVWQARLAQALAAGDLGPLLQAAGAGGQAGGR